MTPEQIQQIIDFKTREQEAELWGTKVTFAPYLCKEQLGDGMQLAFLGTIDQRPKWWLIRIDSKINDTDDFPVEDMIDTIAEECGEYDPDDINEDDLEYPTIKWDGGHYGNVVNFKTMTYEDFVKYNQRKWDEWIK